MYNRRGGMQNNLGGIGRRRPHVQNNFVPGGQLTPQKGGIQHGFNKPAPQANRPQQSQGNTQVRPQQQQQQQQNVPVQTPQINPPQALQPQPPPPPQVSQPQVVPQQQTPTPEVVTPVTPKQENGNLKPEGEKKKWMMRKIPKRERIRKRNMRLGKLLQPKNALMVLNEIVINSTFDVIDFHTLEGTSYKATVIVEGQEHVGFGKSKNSAKNSAAEAALKHLVKSKQMLKILNEDIKMDTSEGETVGESPEKSLPWQQVASFALFKLFDSWGESPIVPKEENPIKELKPAKKLPENAENLNPLMVVNQMFPNALFEELPRSGNPPTCTFHVKITVDGKTFTGSGPTKKMSRRMASYAICSSLLGIKYSPPNPNDIAVPAQ